MKELTLIALLAIGLSGCESNLSNPNRSDNYLTHSESNKIIVFETQALTVYKLNVDGVEYLLADRFQGGITIIKHSK